MNQDLQVDEATPPSCSRYILIRESDFNELRSANEKYREKIEVLEEKRTKLQARVSEIIYHL